MEQYKSTKIKADIHRDIALVASETGLKFQAVQDKALRAGMKLKFGRIVTDCNRNQPPPPTE